MGQEDNKKEVDTHVRATTKPESNKKGAETPGEPSTKPESSEKKTPKALKAKSKIAKKSLASNILNTRKDKGSPQVQRKRRRRKNKHALKGSKESGNNEEDAKKLKSREESKQKNIINKERYHKGHQPQKNQEKIGELEKQRYHKGHQPQKNQEKIGELEKQQHKQRNKGKYGGSDSSIRSQRNEENRVGREKSRHKNEENRVGSSIRSQKNEENRVGREKSRHNENKKEKLGGLIFMCNAKTKPDCFHYGVMGVSTGKKDLVMAVKPGLKLFLYDFDLKLLYGIYKASSSGGMKLEPRAFGGAFPVQVRFSVDKDCFPLPEGIFKKAIKENYNEKHKFKTELTVKQVRKLTELFRPAEVRPTALPVRASQVATVQDREVYESVRESWPHSHKETVARDPYGNGDSRNYSLLSHERDQRIAYRDVASIPREEIPRELYLTEKEYRAYGLKGERRNLTPPSHVTPTLETYHRDYEREHLVRRPDHIYRDYVPAQSDTVRSDPLYLNEKEYRAYGLGARRELPSTVPVATATSATAGSYTNDLYYPYHYGASSGDPYLPSLRRDEVPSGSYSVGGTYPVDSAFLRRAETDPLDRLYSKYDADAQPHYNQTHHYQGAQPEAVSVSVPVSVSSRCSFAGPSFSYR